MFLRCGITSWRCWVTAGRTETPECPPESYSSWNPRPNAAKYLQGKAAYAIKGDSAQARATLARAADSLAQDGAADLNGLLLTARLASLALQLKFDDIAQPAIRALPERLQKMQTDAYGYAQAWQAISKTHSFIADQTLVRHSMAQAYSATQPLIQKSLDNKDFRRSDNVGPAVKHGPFRATNGRCHKGSAQGITLRA